MYFATFKRLEFGKQQKNILKETMQRYNAHRKPDIILLFHILIQIQLFGIIFISYFIMKKL